MELVDRLLSTKGSFFAYQCNLYAPHPKGEDGSIKTIRLSKVCEVEAGKHIAEGNFKSAQMFLKHAVMPLLGKKTVDDKSELNYYFDQIHPRHLPLGFGQNNFHFYAEDPQGDLRLNSKIFRKIGQKPRCAFNPARPISKVKGIELEQNGRDYILSKKLPHFYMKNGSENYFFENLWVSMDIKDRGNKLKVSAPRARKPYHHPFIYADTTICFDGDKRWERKGIQWGTRPINHDLLREIVQAFHETQVNLVEGYQQGVSPVTPLNRTNFQKEYRGIQI